MVTHTPLPWRVSANQPGKIGGFEVIGPYSANWRKPAALVCMMQHHPDEQARAAAEAALIVSAVNTHDDLVAALRAILDDNLIDGNAGFVHVDKMRSIARAALAKLEA